jgi:hypothetical protein
MPDESIGTWEGESCNRNGCTGIIELHPIDGCSCHINPPCSACVGQTAFCQQCGWDEDEE